MKWVRLVVSIDTAQCEAILYRALVLGMLLQRPHTMLILECRSSS
jgi:hypothetical protein